MSHCKMKSNEIKMNEMHLELIVKLVVRFKRSCTRVGEYKAPYARPQTLSLSLGVGSRRPHHAPVLSASY